MCFVICGLTHTLSWTHVATVCYSGGYRVAAVSEVLMYKQPLSPFLTINCNPGVHPCHDLVHRNSFLLFSVSNRLLMCALCLCLASKYIGGFAYTLQFVRSGILGYASNPSTWESKVGRLLVQANLVLHRKFQYHQSYVSGCCFFVCVYMKMHGTYKKNSTCCFNHGVNPLGWRL